VDKESKHLRTDLVFLSKISWEFSRKEKGNIIVNKWEIYFQALEYKRRNFLELTNNNHQSICLTYSKGSAWLKYFGLSNSIYICTPRLIMNHVSIGEYRLRFFSKEFFICIYSGYSIEMRRHILFDCV